MRCSPAVISALLAVPACGGYEAPGLLDGVIACISGSCDDPGPGTILGSRPGPGGGYPAHTVPLVLMPGLAGFSDVHKLLGHFYAGEPGPSPVVFALHVDPYQDTEPRARQAAEQIDVVLALTGASHVDLVAHSQGGLDARMLISGLGYGDRVRTLTTISTPHRGTSLIDVGLGLVPGDGEVVLAALFDVFASLATGSEAALLAQLQCMSRQHTASFNALYPDDKRVAYYAYGARTQPRRRVDRTRIDVVHPLLLPTYLLLRRTDGDNDGLVPTASARWGDYRGTLWADHIDLLAEMGGNEHPAFEPVGFYQALARGLRAEGAPPQW